MESAAERFHNLFRGLEESHGTFAITGQRESGKLEGRALTLKEPVTTELWTQHLAGKRSLGVVPINRDSKCKWSCIDVDTYPIDHAALIDSIQSLHLPLNVFKSKSGGAHLILILNDFIPAAKMAAVLKSWVAALKLGKVEVFPKQTKVMADAGHVGNWLNMPYFGETRRLLDKSANEVPLDKFFEHVLTVDPIHAKEFKLSLEDSPIKDGPPCLQTLSLAGFPEGSRNNGLFALGTYCKRAYPEHWRQKLSEYNKELFKPPLDLAEVKVIVGQLEKHDYKYRCHDQPISMHCNANICRGRKHGVGDGALPIVSGVTKYLNPGGDNEWFLEIGDRCFGVTAEELSNRAKFSAKLMNVADIALPDVKASAWKAFIQSILDAAKDKPIEMPFSDTVRGQFHDLLKGFVENRANTDRTLISTGKVWIDTDTGRALFRLKDLVRHLSRRNFTKWSDTKIAKELRDVYQADIERPRNDDGSRDYAYAIMLDRVGMAQWVEPKRMDKEIL